MSFDFTVEFVINRVSGNLELILTDVSDLSSFDSIKGFWRIDFPDGIFQENTDLNNPDFTKNSSQKTFAITRYKKFLTGNYKITQKIYHNNDEYIFIKNVVLSFEELDLFASDNSNTFIPTVSFINETFLNVNSYSIVSASNTISSNFPVGITASPLSTSNQELLMSDNGDFYEGVYSPLVSIDVVYSGSGHTVRFIKSKSFSFDIRKTPNADDLVNLLNVLKERLDNSVGQERLKLEQAYQQLVSLYSHVIAKTINGQSGAQVLIREMMRIAYSACSYCFKPSDYVYSLDPLTEPDSISFATELWVAQNFYPLNSNPAGYLTTETDPVFTSWLNTNPLSGFATETWVNTNFYNKTESDNRFYPLSNNPANYLIESDLSRSNWDAAFSWGDHALAGYLTTETDPTVPSHVKAITSTQVSNWDNAFSWGDHALAGYLTSESDPIFAAWLATNPLANFLTENDISRSNWDAAFSWGDHALAGYLTTETDPTVPSHVKGITSTQISNWDLAFGWGDHALAGYLTTEVDPVFTAWLATNPLTGLATETWVTNNFYPLNSNPAGYLTSFTETDPVFTAWLATNPLNGLATETWVNNNFYDKTASDNRFYPLSSNPAGYLTTETDPTVPSHVKAITSTQISNWDAAFGWGDHALAGYLTSSSIAGLVPYTGANANVNLGEFGLSTGHVVFDTTPTNTPTSQGTMAWDEDKLALSVVLNGYKHIIGGDVFYPVKNTTGSSIPKGTAVQFAGTIGNSGRLLIAPFIANGSVPSTFFMGVTAETIAHDAEGKVLWFGELRGINTNAFNEGDILYASTTTAGAFQTAVPQAPNNIVQIAAVVTKSATVGAIFIRPTFGANINKDEGVKITTPTTGQILQLQSNGLWENVSNGNLTQGTGIALSGTLTGRIIGSGNVTVAHGNTSAQATVTNSNGNVIQSVTLDSFGHITGLASTNLDTRFQLLSEKGNANGYASLDGNGKVPLTQINDALLGNVNFQGLWNASTNTPTLVNPPSSATKGHYYIVDTAGTFASIDFEVGDWIISNGTTWDKVDNTDAVSSVFGRTGNVTAQSGDYNTSQVTESGNLYYTDARARAALSFTAGSGAYNSTTGVITIPTNNNQITNGAGYITSAALGAYLPLTGGTMTGVITTPNSTFGIIIGDDSRLADRDVANTLFLEGVQNNDRGYINFSQTNGNALGAINGQNLTWRGNTIWHAGNFDPATKLNTTLTSAQIFVGNASNVATGVSLSLNASDGTFGLSNTGQLTFPNASGSSRGLLTSTDWTTFNNKSNLALGETSTTAYRGDRGVIAYDYSQVGHLPLAGGTLTGGLTGTTISMSGQLTNTVASGTAPFVVTSTTRVANLNVATAGVADVASAVVRTVTGTNSAELVRGNMADNDQARILVGGTASDAGFLEIATADNGNEPIHVRQYTGVFTTLVRTATLLDGSGNTSFPNNVTAASFNLITGLSNTNPTMNGTAAIGSSTLVSRQDHVHPTDTSRAAASHTHGNITNAGAIGSVANLPIITGASGVLQAGSFGTTANTFAAGDDARIINGQTAFGWGNHALIGYAVNGTGGSQVRTNDQLDSRYARLNLGTPASMEINREVLASGIYSYRVMSTTTNKPSGLTFGATINFGIGASGSAQLLVGWTSGDRDWIGFRSLRDTTDNWWDWKRIYHDNYKPNADKWTTARTLTIGATGKSVDGSGNVSWTLAEIGAQAALTNPITGTGTAGQVSYWNGTNTQTGGDLTWDNGNRILQTTGSGTLRTSTGNLTLATAAGNGNILLSPHGSGRVGIGTTNPASTLHVSKASAVFQITDTNKTANNSLWIQALSQTSWGIGTADNSASGTKITIADSGNVGIGTTLPAYKLSIIGNAGIEQSEEYFYFNSNYVVGNNARGKIRAVGAGGGSGFGGDLRFSSRASNNVWNEDVLTIANTGNVGIGVTNPNSKLHIDGSLTFTEANFSTVRRHAIRNSHSDGSNPNNYLGFDVSNGVGTTSERMRINGAGNLLIGTTSDNGARLQVNGTVASGYIQTNAVGGAGNQEGLRIVNNNAYLSFFNSANTTRSAYIQGNTTDLTINTSLAIPILFGTSNVTKMTLTDSGNLGLGVTPSAWNTAYKAIQNGQASIMSRASADDSYWLGNAYFDSSGWKRINTGFANKIEFGNGMSLAVAGSNSNDTAITWNQAMTLTNAGNAIFNGTISSGDITTNGDNKGLYFNGTRNAILGNNTLEEVYIATANVERLRITSGGNVGIGTTDPKREMVLYRSSGEVHFKLANGTTGESNADGFDMAIDSIGGAYLINRENQPMHFFTNGTERLRITSGGDLLFKGRSTTTNLEAVFYNDNSQLAINASNTSTGKTINFNHRNDITAMTITSGGNVLINSTSDNGARLQVSGNVFVNDDSTSGNGVQLRNADRPLITRGWDAFTSGNKTGVGRWGVFMEAAELFLGSPGTDYSNGLVTIGGWLANGTREPNLIVNNQTRNVLIGTTTALTNGGRLQVNGDGRFTGDVIAFSSSDARLKDNLTKITDPIEKILKLGGYSFTWNDKQDTYTGNDYGVIAQEVEAVFPELVQTRDNGMKAVKYDKLVPVLIEAIKELSNKVKVLEGGK